LGLGDSFTYGAGAPFDETYLRSLEMMLNSGTSADSGFEVIKVGIQRYFPEPERLLLQHYGIQFKPDLILVGFIPNDVMDSYMGLEAITISDDGTLKTDEAAQLGEVGTFLYHYSHLARILLRKYVSFKLSRKYQIDWPEVYEPDGLDETTWRNIEAEYSKMVKTARSAGAEIVFIHIPISPDEAAYFDIKGTSYPADRLKKWAANEQVLFIDTLPVLMAAEMHQVLYWPQDGHSNCAGYAVIAETIYEKLMDNNLLPD